MRGDADRTARQPLMSEARADGRALRGLSGQDGQVSSLHFSEMSLSSTGSRGSRSRWGGPGLFLIGYLDSSFLSFPEVNDLLIMGMVTQHKHRLLYYALHGDGGIGARMPDALLRRAEGRRGVSQSAFKAPRRQGLKLFQKYGLLVVIVPALLPPPAPFKIFVLLAGVAAIPVWQFVPAIAVARGIRYGGEGLLAVYVRRQRRTRFFDDHAKEAGLWLAGIALVLGVIWVLVKQWRAGRPQDA